MNELKEYLLKTKSAEHWKKIGFYHHHGIVIPLFSLRTAKSSGIGEYLDLIDVIDWCKNIGFDVIQLLPLNESLTDSPYNCLSSCSLNPIHISLHALEMKNNNMKQKLNEFKVFDSFQRINYPQLQELKTNFLKEYYLNVFDDLKTDNDFKTFKKNNDWLDEYSLFKSLLEEQNYKNWNLWPAELQNINDANIEQYKEKYENQMNYHSFIQYLCYKQFSAVKKHADLKKVFLLGDFPMFINTNSCDVWYNKSLFDLTLSAGTPPDAFNEYGQKWNFPLFNWEELKKTDYSWWKKRLDSISNIYHLYRIDHVVGLFRIWCVDFDKFAFEGNFFPSDPALWEKNGNEKLTMLLNNSNLLPIAEDLGLIPEIVYYTLRKFGICGTKVVFWQKDSNGYIKFDNYDSLSLTTLSTHDTFTFGEWWKKSEDESSKFAQFKNWTYQPKLTYHQRKELLKDSHHTTSIFHINLFQEYLALYPELVWPKIEDERINVPGTVEPTNWSYRFRKSFEEIVDHKDFEKDLKDILS